MNRVFDRMREFCALLRSMGRSSSPEGWRFWQFAEYSQQMNGAAKIPAQSWPTTEAIMKTRTLVLLISGVLTPIASQAQNVYKNANFAVTVAAGWQAQEGTPMVSFVNEKAKASISLGVMTGSADKTPTAEKELQNIESQFPDNCPQAKIKQRGPTTLGGWSGAFLIVNCVDKDAGLEVMKYAAATKPGVMVMLISASPAGNYEAVLPAMNSIEHSLRILNGGGQQSGANSQSQTPAGSGMYRDPQGRYRLSVPDGWNTSVDNGTLQVSSGSSWAVLMTGGGSQAGDVNHQVTQQIQAQYTQFQKLNEGDLQVNGHPAHGTTATGINPKGERVSVLVLSIGAGSGNFLTVVSSSPNDQAKVVNATVMQMAQSIRFAGE